MAAGEREAVGRALLEALQYAAAQGITHHDLKPANVLFSSNGAGAWCLAVSNFGLARSVIARARAMPVPPLFSAPEADSEMSDGLAADTFSAGQHYRKRAGGGGTSSSLICST